MFQGHGFFVKWAGKDERGYVSSREAAEFCPELLIKFYQSRITWNDEEEVAVKLRDWALDFKVKLTYLNFTKFKTYLNFTKFRTDLNFTKFKTDLNFTNFRTDLTFTKLRIDFNFTKFKKDLIFTKFRTDLKFSKFRLCTETIEGYQYSEK